jgi:hypothetical protein
MKLRYSNGLTYDIVQHVADTLALTHIKYIELHQNIFVLKHDKDIGLVYQQVIPHRLNAQDTFNPVVPSTNQATD